MDKIYQILTCSVGSSLNHNISLHGNSVPMGNKAPGKLIVNYYKLRLSLNLIFDKYKSIIRYFL